MKIPLAEICHTKHCNSTSMILSWCLQHCHARWYRLVRCVWLCVWPAAGGTTRHGDTRCGLCWRHDDTGANRSVPRLCWIQVWAVFHNMKRNVRAEVLSAVLLEIQTVWNVMLCCWTSGCWSFKGSKILELSETVHPMTQHHIPEGSKLNTMDSYEIHIVCVCVLRTCTHPHTLTRMQIF